MSKPIYVVEPIKLNDCILEKKLMKHTDNSSIVYILGHEDNSSIIRLFSKSIVLVVTPIFMSRKSLTFFKIYDVNNRR